MVELISITIPILTGIFFIAYKEYIIFKNYVNYLYYIMTIFLVFTLGWNSSLFYSGVDNPLIIDWKYLIVVFVSIIIVRVFAYIGKVKHYGNHLVENEW